MNVLILGSGGREHAFAYSIANSEGLDNLYIAPGNAGTKNLGINVDLALDDFPSIHAFCLVHDVTMVIVGPEAPLVGGIVDSFAQPDFEHIHVIGPDAYAAQLEGSKAFAKSFMKTYNIPTARYLEVTSANLDEGNRFIREELNAPYVLKADGLAAGKGVLIIDNLDEAITSLETMINGQFGAASTTVVIEEYLAGIEFSVFVLTDGKDYILLPEAKDYKRIGEGDTGLNTGGMGAISPVPFVDSVLMDKVKSQIIDPTIYGIQQEKMNYVGFVFFGLINVGGNPYVIEYNCRMGDPETEVVFPRINSDVLNMFRQVSTGRINEVKLDINREIAATIMMVSGGYPQQFEKGKIINNIPLDSDGSIVFHSGTINNEHDIITAGGRVLSITSFGNTIQEATEKSILIADQIDFEGKYYRRDIGFDLI